MQSSFTNSRTLEVTMRLAVFTFLITLVLVPAAPAQMTGTGPVNMMSGELLAPAAGRGPGAAGSFWKTDLWLKSTAGSSVTLDFHIMDSTTDAATATARLTMSSAVMYLPDVLKSTFGLDQAFGNIVIRGTSPVSATIRAYTAGGGGAYGTAFMAMPTLMAMRGSGGMMDDDDRYELRVLGLQPQPRARVNLMVTNSGTIPISGTVDLLDADGQPPLGASVSLPFSIRAYSSHQFGDILGGLTSRFGDGSQMQIRVRVANNSTGMVMALASVVDNATNDTYTVMGSMMSFGGGSGMMP
jgi:hypothetical protein